MLSWWVGCCNLDLRERPRRAAVDAPRHVPASSLGWAFRPGECHPPEAAARGQVVKENDELHITGFIRNADREVTLASMTKGIELPYELKKTRIRQIVTEVVAVDWQIITEVIPYDWQLAPSKIASNPLFSLQHRHSHTPCLPVFRFARLSTLALCLSKGQGVSDSVRLRSGQLSSGHPLDAQCPTMSSKEKPMSTMSLFAWLAQHNYAGLLVEEKRLKRSESLASTIVRTIG